MKKRIQIIVCAVFAAFLGLCAAAFWILPDKPFSEDENRALQTLPAPSLSDWADGSLSAAFTAYCSDQFPLRSSLVGLHSLYELSLGRGESSGVLLGRDGQLAVRLFDMYVSRTQRVEDTDYPCTEHVRAGMDALAALKNTSDEAGVPLVVMLPPRTVDVAVSAFGYPSDLSDKLNATVTDALADAGVTYVDLLPAMRTLYDAGEYVYYRTDHHWTTRGAYEAYTSVLGALNTVCPPAAAPGAPVPADAFTIRTVPDFRGTTWSRAGTYFTAPDTMEIWEAESDACYTVRDENGEALLNGFIDESYLSGKDKYGAFLSGTHRLLTVTQTAPDPLSPDTGGTRPRLLLARDSFASALVPFLARHYDLVVVNLATGPQGVTDLSALAAEYACDAVLIVWNLENVLTSDGLRNVK